MSGPTAHDHRIALIDRQKVGFRYVWAYRCVCGNVSGHHSKDKARRIHYKHVAEMTPSWPHITVKDDPLLAALHSPESFTGCPHCGGTFPTPFATHHTESDCLNIRLSTAEAKVRHLQETISTARELVDEWKRDGDPEGSDDERTRWEAAHEMSELMNIRAADMAHEIAMMKERLSSV